MHLTVQGLRVVEQASLDPQLLARGCIAADPDFFRLFGAGEQDVARVLATLALDGSSDYSSPMVANAGQGVVGFLFSYPLREMFSRQAQSLRQLLSLAVEPAGMRAPLSDLARSKEALREAESFYLARIYVVDEARGHGVGEALMQAFTERARRLGFACLSLHVRRENAVAQRFYARLGFRSSGASPAAAYLGMEKRL